MFDKSLDETDSVADFGILFSAYLKLEQTIAETSDDDEDFERLEALIERRPFLLSNVILR